MELSLQTQVSLECNIEFFLLTTIALSYLFSVSVLGRFRIVLTSMQCFWSSNEHERRECPVTVLDH